MADRTRAVPLPGPDPPSSRVAATDDRKWAYSDRCSGDRRQQTTDTTLGGRWAERSAFVRRRMNWFTTAESSPARSLPKAATSGAAPGSRPARMGASNRRRNVAASPSTPGFAKSTIA